MAEKGSNLFRKSSLERVSSPEQLNEYIKVNNPSLILILIGLFVIIISGVVWMFSGGIPETVSLNGVIVEEGGKQEVCCYVPISSSQRLSEGMRTQISLDYAGREEYGYINGAITSVGKEVVTNEYLRANFENPQVVIPAVQAAMQTGGNVVEVRMDIGEWYTEKVKQVKLSEGADCKVDAIVGETKAYQFIINS